MPLPRFRIRTLMIAAAVVALWLAGLLCGSPFIVILAVATPFALLWLAFLWVVRKVGRDTLV